MYVSDGNETLRVKAHSVKAWHNESRWIFTIKSALMLSPTIFLLLASFVFFCMLEKTELQVVSENRSKMKNAHKLLPPQIRVTECSCC